MAQRIRRVIVAGGGIGGLCTAIALRAQGREVVVCERAPEPRLGGSGLVLSPNGMRAIAALDTDLYHDVQAAGAVYGPEHLSRFMTARGGTLAQVSFATSKDTWGEPIMGILRSRLHEVLLRHATKAGATIRTGTAVTSYVDGDGAVTAALADGSSAEGDLLVGADGLRSAVRAVLLGDGEPTYRGFSAVRGVGPAPVDDPHGFIAYGRGLVLFCASVVGGEAYWVASITAPEGIWPGKDTQTAHRDLLARLDRWQPATAALVAESDPASLLVTDIHDRDPVSGWHAGRVVLLGDAAHPMVYTVGQGANTTLEDAVVLAHRLRVAPTVSEALTAYSAERAPRLAKMVRQSRMMGVIGQTSNPVGAWARNRMMSLMTRLGDLDKQNASVFGWTPPQG